MVLHGKIEYNTEPQINSMLPFQTPERMDQLPSPRIINSHMYFRKDDARINMFLLVLV
jgi:hypothetical protein